MINTGGSLQGQSMALDSRSLENLKTATRADKGSDAYNQAIEETAQQFEAIFLQWALKSMRQATPEGGLFNDQTSKSFRAMYDQELVQHISGKGVGLAGEIARQLKGLSGIDVNSSSTLGKDGR
ncbi:MAG: rod-binding protein [Limnobacter sp.]|nr:rod-binding protein [Limnobacter sp.]